MHQTISDVTRDVRTEQFFQKERTSKEQPTVKKKKKKKRERERKEELEVCPKDKSVNLRFSWLKK